MIFCPGFGPIRSSDASGRIAEKMASCAKSSSLSISSARARADQCTIAGETWRSLTEACASVIATGTYSSVMPPRPWRSSRCPRPNNATWSRLFRASKKSALSVDCLGGLVSYGVDQVEQSRKRHRMPTWESGVLFQRLHQVAATREVGEQMVKWIRSEHVDARRETTN